MPSSPVLFHFVWSDTLLVNEKLAQHQVTLQLVIFSPTDWFLLPTANFQDGTTQAQESVGQGCRGEHHEAAG